MKDTLAQLFITGVGVAFLACLATFALAGLYVMGRWAWELWSGWRQAVAPTRQPHAARLVDAEAEGWLDDMAWPFPGRAPETAETDLPALERLPRVGVAA